MEHLLKNVELSTGLDAYPSRFWKERFLFQAYEDRNLFHSDSLHSVFSPCQVLSLSLFPYHHIGGNVS